MKLVYMIINYNDTKSVHELLSQIQDYSCIDEILIVDNHSTDSSFAKLKKVKNKKVRVVQTKENKGYSSAINFGTKDILERYSDANVVISNADIILSSEEDLKVLAKGLSQKHVGIVAPTIVEHGSLNRGWKLPTPNQDILENIVFLNRFFKRRKLYPESYYEKKTSIVDVVSGCIFLMRASTIKKVNFLDEGVFLYYEEAILAKKLQNISLHSVIYNQIAFVHNHSVSIDKSVKKLNKYKILKKSQAYFEKNYNHANSLQRGLLWFTNWTSYLILAIIYWVQDLYRNGG